MHLTRPAALLLLVALAAVTGCSSAVTQAPAAGSGAPSATRITVTLSDALKIEPAQINVPMGVPVTFVVTNKGTTNHEFFVGSEKAQSDHDKAMSGQMAMEMDEPTGIGVKPGATKELTLTFADTTPIVGGCHIPGHYLAGMKATITVQ